MRTRCAGHFRLDKMAVNHQAGPACAMMYLEGAGQVLQESAVAVIMAATIRMTALMDTETNDEPVLAGNRKPAAESPRENTAMEGAGGMVATATATLTQLVQMSTVDVAYRDAGVGPLWKFPVATVVAVK